MKSFRKVFVWSESAYNDLKYSKKIGNFHESQSISTKSTPVRAHATVAEPLSNNKSEKIVTDRTPSPYTRRGGGGESFVLMAEKLPPGSGTVA